MKRTRSLILAFCFLPLFLIGQNESPLELIVGEVQSIVFDRAAFEKREIEDSLRIEQWKKEHEAVFDTASNGSIITTGPSKSIFMRSPYLVELYVKKQFTKGELEKNIKVRVWTHENAKYSFEEPFTYAFVLQQNDSSEIYECLHFYAVFKTRWGAYAEPVRYNAKIYPKARKAFFNYKLLKEENKTHYQLLKDEVECCMDQLEKL
ncbi:hypothetical protein Oweho_1637 [Owenweeksia hongkongensis DSM 17368]|uniref:Uncharacterized protein n=1 Tax=Owenweeksia hongkongensis (strain DSM 17368 / CIP 108786 / JCM 12287 / NRRL B-23963 / UST20020801) TaxID=926562 RepID=G8QZY5_OWEHD|nr:hypothetical protein [Owenweeksia hongkongensis]AEV32625.1 hypothetical protein Oweho_1637 [Owenweeksia hongkongensis DSM 17368]